VVTCGEVTPNDGSLVLCWGVLSWVIVTMVEEGMVADGEMACPGGGSASARQDGRDRKGAQVYRCRGGGRHSTPLSATPCSGYRCPPDVNALAVRWYLRDRLRYADVAELLAERGVRVDASTVYDGVHAFAPRYEDAARPFRHGVGGSWSVDETYTQVAGRPASVYRAIDGRGQVVDVYVSRERATEDAATSFRRAVEATGVVPDTVATDCAAAYSPALAAVLPEALHETGKAIQQRIERDHQHLQGRSRGMRGFKTLAGARVLCRAHAFLRNLRAGCYDRAGATAGSEFRQGPPVACAWAALTEALLA